MQTTADTNNDVQQAEAPSQNIPLAENMQPAGEVTDAVSNEAINHANRAFEYIKYLNQIENNRSQSMIVLNAIMNAFLGLFAKDINTLKNMEKSLLAAAFAFSALSLIMALRIFWPKTDDWESPLHHTGVRMYKTWKEYAIASMRCQDSQIVSDICREVWVVSGITKWRGTQVKRSAFLFVCSLITAVGLLYGIVFRLF